AHVAERALRQPQQLTAVQLRGAGRAAVVREEAEQREHALALARARLADDAERLAALEIERQPLDRVHFAVRRRELDVEIPDFEQRHSALQKRGQAPSPRKRGWAPFPSDRLPVLRIERIAQAVA